MSEVQGSSNRVRTLNLQQSWYYCDVVRFGLVLQHVSTHKAQAARVCSKACFLMRQQASSPHVAKLANRDPVAAHKVAAQSEREWLFLLITGEIKHPSTDVVVSRAGLACKATVYCTHAP